MSESKFWGTSENFQKLLTEHYLGIEINTQKGNNITFQAKTPRDMIINFFQSIKTVQVQKDNDEDRSILNDLLKKTSRSSKNKIFIVHGHDKSSKDELELILRRLKIEPVILQNNPVDGATTLIEALEKNIGECKMGIVLLTPDDIGYAQKDGEEKKRPRARQNVILEMGMLLGALGRDKVITIRKSDTELPSDTRGIIYLAYDSSVHELEIQLQKSIKQAGIVIMC